MLKNNESYLCLSAIVRAREPRLLDSERISRMLAAPTFAECARMLTDSGYEDMSGMNSAGICAALNRHREEIFREIERLSPDKVLTEIFRMPYDCHNAKVIIKSEGLGALQSGAAPNSAARENGRAAPNSATTNPTSGETGSKLMLVSGRIPPERLVQFYNSGEFGSIPGRLGPAMKEAGELLARTSNPQLADFILDRACYGDISDAAGESGNAFLRGYAALLVDTANFRTVVRAVRLGKITDVLRDALISGGRLNSETVLRTLDSADTDAIISLFSSAGLEKAAASAKTALEGGTLTGFELDCDNIVTAFLRNAKYVSYGPEPVVAYLAGVENEITAVRMILTGRLAGIDSGVIGKRLRDMYV